METYADTVIVGGAVFTGADVTLSEALAVHRGRIASVGPLSEMSTRIGPDTRVIEARGRFIMPGFIDSHVHFLTGGFKLSGVQLRDAASPDEFVRRLGAFARAVEPGSWITGGDWDHERWGGMLPHRSWIDGVTPHNPVCVNRLDGHMALANSLALEAAGVSAATALVEGGQIVRDPETGDPTGILKDEAMVPVFRAMPQPTEADLDRALAAAAAHALSHGVTQVHDMAGWSDLETYRRAHSRGALPLRVYSAVPLSSWQEMRDYIGAQGPGDSRLWWGAVKAFVDGSLGSTTAWFHEPYEDDAQNVGLAVTDLTELRSRILDADRAGLHLIVHAIGDRANDWLLDVFAEARVANGSRDRRFRVEHAQHLSPGACDRFGAEGVIASMQPYHVADDGRWAENRIGAARTSTTYAFRSMLDAHATLAFGSDWTVAPMNVALGLDAAVSRRTLDGANPGGWVPEQRISMEQAMRAYTVGGAYAGFSDGFSGTLQAGKYADLVMLSENLLAIDPVGVPSVLVDMTMVEGVVAYERENAT